jgi:hypothetical protein
MLGNLFFKKLLRENNFPISENSQKSGHPGAWTQSYDFWIYSYNASVVVGEEMVELNQTPHM